MMSSMIYVNGTLIDGIYENIFFELIHVMKFAHTLFLVISISVLTVNIFINDKDVNYHPIFYE